MLCRTKDDFFIFCVWIVGIKNYSFIFIFSRSENIFLFEANNVLWIEDFEIKLSILN